MRCVLDWGSVSWLPDDTLRLWCMVCSLGHTAVRLSLAVGLQGTFIAGTFYCAGKANRAATATAILGSATILFALFCFNLFVPEMEFVARCFVLLCGIRKFCTCDACLGTALSLGLSVSEIFTLRTLGDTQRP